MPSAKRTKTEKSSQGKKGRRSPKTPKKRLPLSVVVPWVLALSLLATLLYFAGRNRHLPPSLPPRQPPRVTQTPPSQALTNPPRHANPKTAAALPPIQHPSPAAKPQTSPPPKVSPPLPATARLARNPRLARKPQLAIVIDDLGPNIAIARQFASLPFPVTLSVLPFQTYSAQIAKMARTKGRETILHLPMEPLNSRINPGRGALLASMTPAQLRLRVNAALDTSPYFDGVNNHMGSKLTQNPKAMQVVLSVLKERKLFFIDSMTINSSVGWKEARRMSVPTFKRNIFLDDNLCEAAIRSQIARAVEIAKTRGAALAIGHPHEITLRTLLAAAPYFRDEGVQLVPVRALASKK